MTREEVFNKTVTVIRNCAPELDGMELKNDTVVNTDMGIDSMGFILIICKIEGLFDVRIPENEWQKLVTLGDVVDAVMVRLPKE